MSNANPHADLTTNTHGGTESTRPIEDGGPAWEFCDAPNPKDAAMTCGCPKGHESSEHWNDAGTVSWSRR
jgi:hypothetical protein